VGEVRVECQQQRRALLDDADSGMTMTVNPALVPFGLFKPALQIEIVLGEFRLFLSYEQPRRKTRHDTAHVLPDRIVTRVQLPLYDLKLRLTLSPRATRRFQRALDRPECVHMGSQSFSRLVGGRQPPVNIVG
jgi:hypothetical protein